MPAADPGTSQSYRMPACRAALATRYEPRWLLQRCCNRFAAHHTEASDGRCPKSQPEVPAAGPAAGSGSAQTATSPGTPARDRRCSESASAARCPRRDPLETDGLARWLDQGMHPVDFHPAVEVALPGLTPRSLRRAALRLRNKIAPRVKDPSRVQTALQERTQDPRRSRTPMQ